MKKTDFNPEFMRLAIREARKNLEDMAGGPFGACIVKDGRVLATARNTVLKNDATCHAEVNAVRIAAKKTGRYDLSGSVIYSTTEPCPMCFSAIHWARIDAIVYGTDIADVRKLGFRELPICCRKMRLQGRSRVKILSGFQKEACRSLLQDWHKLPNRTVY